MTNIRVADGFIGRSVLVYRASISLANIIGKTGEIAAVSANQHGEVMLLVAVEGRLVQLEPGDVRLQ